MRFGHMTVKQNGKTLWVHMQDGKLTAKEDFVGASEFMEDTYKAIAQLAPVGFTDLAFHPT